MRTISISALKARLSEFLALVQAGEDIIVTDRGTPVARLVPLQGPAELDARAQRLVREGLARPAGELPEAFWDAPRPRDPGGWVRTALETERREGR